MNGFKVPGGRSKFATCFQPLSGLFLGGLVLAGCSGENVPSADVPRGIDVPQLDRQASVPSESDISEFNTAKLLEIGDKAPEISSVQWLKGNPVTVADSSTILVLEFWETDCAPCLEVIPQVCALQAEYGDRVTFARISPEEQSVVTEFLNDVSGDGHRKWSEVLNVAVGIDPQRQSWAAYLDAAEHQGIPCTVVIGRNSLVEWMGHPDDLKGPLKKIVDGTWNSAEARKLAAVNRLAKQAKQELSPEIRAVIDAREYSRAVTLIDEFLQRFPNDVDLEFLRLKCLIQDENFEHAHATAEKLIAAAQDDARQLDKLAWMIATTSESPKVNLDIALAAAQRAAELTEHTNCSVIETLARVHFLRGRVEEAIVLQEQAIQLAANSEDAKPLRATLDEYRSKHAENP